MSYILAAFPSSSESFIYREIGELIKRGIDVRIFALKRSDDADQEHHICTADLKSRVTYARPDNVLFYLLLNLFAIVRHPLRYIATVRPFIRTWKYTEPSQFFKSLYHFLWGVGISAAIGKAGNSHIHAHFTAGCNAALAVHNYMGISFSFTAHASGDIFVKPVLINEKLKAAKFVIAACDYSRKYLDSVTRYHFGEKIVTIYNAISTEEVAKFIIPSASKSDEVDFVDQRVKIVSVGRLLDPKGFMTLIDACNTLKGRGMKFRCLIIGSGHQKTLIAQRILKHSLTDVVEIKNFTSLEDTYKELTKADIFVLLSHIGKSGFRDGFPTVILEAMHCSLPVVSTWISGIPEMVINGKTGFLVHERDSLAAADALEKLISDQNLRVNYGSAGKQRAMELFNLNNNIEQYLRLLQ